MAPFNKAKLRERETSGKIRLALLAGLGFFLWACQSTPSAFISGKADPTFRFRPSQPIFVDLSETATPRDIQFRKLLVSEMNDQGFTLAEELSEDSLILFFTVRSESNTLMAFPGSPSGALYRIPNQQLKTTLQLYTIQDPTGHPVWEGHLEAKQETFDVHRKAAVSELVRKVGKNFEGTVPIQFYDPVRPEVEPEGLARLKEKVKALEGQMNQMGKKQPMVEEQPRDETSKAPLAVQSKRSPNTTDLIAACHNGESQACTELGFRYQTGNGVPKSFDKARAFYEKGCQNHNGRSCVNLGLMYLEGTGVVQDQDRAATLFKKGCKLGVSHAC
jgi:hypothetical protein